MLSRLQHLKVRRRLYGAFLRFLGRSAVPLRLEGNRQLFARFPDFVRELEETRAQHPLASPRAYYPYGTIHNIAQMLPIADEHGIDLLSCVEGRTILDLGTGDGELSFFLELFRPRQVVAVDAAAFNFNGLAGFRSLHGALGSKVTLIDADAHYLDFAQLPHFDVTFCLGFLYHSRHPMWILEKLAAASELLFLNTKVFDADEAYAYFYRPGECNDDASNWWCYSPQAVERMLARAGFTVGFSRRIDRNVGRSHPVELKRDGRLLVYARSERLARPPEAVPPPAPSPPPRGGEQPRRAA